MLRRYLKENGYCGQQHSRWRDELKLHQALTQKPQNEKSKSSCAKGVSEDDDSHSCANVSEDEDCESCANDTDAMSDEEGEDEQPLAKLISKRKYRVRVVPRPRPRTRFRVKVVAPKAIAKLRNSRIPSRSSNHEIVISQPQLRPHLKLWAAGVLAGEVVFEEDRN